jgi:hypothetical protein
MEDVTMDKNGIEALELNEPLDRMNALAYMRKFKVVPYWTEDRRLILRLLRQLNL